MEPHFEIRLAGRIDPGPKPAATDELAIAVIKQRPILNATGPLPLDLGAELLSDLGIGEFAAGIDERRDGGIAPQFHRKGQILDLPWPRHEALGPEFFRFRHDRRREWPLSASGPIPALHSDTGASGTGSSNPACSSGESRNKTILHRSAAPASEFA